jgi:FMN phosphatase YigB (HAD superfamily)
MLRVVLLDVGGTLWPNAWPSRPNDNEERAARLHQAVPSVAEHQATALVGVLAALDHPPGEEQQTGLIVAEAIRKVIPRVPVPVPLVIEAMCLPAWGRVQPFPGARELLSRLAGRGVRIVVVSNVLWRDSRAQRRDFEDLGLSGYVNDYVTSLDVGWRKPHPFFFDAALGAAGYPSSECAMVGDSEANDIVPAHARGLLCIRVALEEPLPSTTVGDKVCGSLHDVAYVLTPTLR